MEQAMGELMQSGRETLSGMMLLSISKSTYRSAPPGGKLVIGSGALTSTVLAAAEQSTQLHENVLIDGSSNYLNVTVH